MLFTEREQTVLAYVIAWHYFDKNPLTPLEMRGRVLDEKTGEFGVSESIMRQINWQIAFKLMYLAKNYQEFTQTKSKRRTLSERDQVLIALKAHKMKNKEIAKRLFNFHRKEFGISVGNAIYLFYRVREKMRWKVFLNEKKYEKYRELQNALMDRE